MRISLGAIAFLVIATTIAAFSATLVFTFAGVSLDTGIMSGYLILTPAFMLFASRWLDGREAGSHAGT